MSAWLIHRGCTVHRVDTRGAHEFRKFTSRNVKSDSADAEALARMPNADPRTLRPLVLPDADHQGLDRLTRLRAQIVDDRTRVVNLLLATVETYAPTYIPVLGKGLTNEKRFLVRHFLDHRKAAEIGHQGIVAAALLAEPAVRVSLNLVDAWIGAATEMRELIDPLGDEVPWSYDVAQIEIETHFDLIECIDARVAELERQIAALYARVDPDSTLVTLPGIGPVIAPLLMAVIGNILRFSNVKRFVSFCGMAPRKNQTGRADRQGQPISKSGNRRMRHYLFLAADASRRTDPQLAAIYARHTGKGAHLHRGPDRGRRRAGQADLRGSAATRGGEARCGERPCFPYRGREVAGDVQGGVEVHTRALSVEGRAPPCCRPDEGWWSTGAQRTERGAADRLPDGRIGHPAPHLR